MVECKKGRIEKRLNFQNTEFHLVESQKGSNLKRSNFKGSNQKRGEFQRVELQKSTVKHFFKFQNNSIKGSKGRATRARFGPSSCPARPFDSLKFDQLSFDPLKFDLLIFDLSKFDPFLIRPFSDST